MRLKRNNIYQGDCLELMRYVPSKSVDMVLCDLPYGTTRNKWDSVIPLEPLWLQYERIIKDNGAIVLFAQTPFDKVLGASNLDMLRYEWIWEKGNATGFLNANRCPLKKHENILVFYKHQPTYSPQHWYGKPYKVKRNVKDRTGTNYGALKDDFPTISEDGKRYPLSILKFTEDRGLHPTQKPLDLCRYLIRTYTQPNELVLDNTMGSGTSCVAAKLEGRKWLGFERDETIFEAARIRIETTELEQCEQATDILTA